MMATSKERLTFLKHRHFETSSEIRSHHNEDITAHKAAWLIVTNSSAG
jgi:hypothetical protein